MKIYSTTHRAIVEAPIIEMPRMTDFKYDLGNHDFDRDAFNKDYYDYNKWLSTHKPVPDEFKDYWADGQEVKEGIDYEIIDSNKYWLAICEICGWQGSSEKLLGGSQIADTGDIGDIFCPKCESKDIGDSDILPDYEGLLAIPIIKQVSEEEPSPQAKASDLWDKQQPEWVQEKALEFIELQSQLSQALSKIKSQEAEIEALKQLKN